VIVSVAAALGLLPAALLAQADLPQLAELDGVSGREEIVAIYVRERLGDRAVTDNTGSLTLTCGSGAPHTLLIAGLDEPGYVVAGIRDDGYLTVQRPDSPPHYQFDRFFPGWPVWITTRANGRIAGIVASPASHFSRSSMSSVGALEDLRIDVGASSRDDVLAAGIEVLDGVSLAKEFIPLGRDKASAPWISSRSGAFLLLNLAGRLQAAPPPGTVTLAFVTRQHSHNTGLERVLQRVRADRVVVLRQVTLFSREI
jgi:putative aminopeptidase FrvX